MRVRSTLFRILFIGLILGSFGPAAWAAGGGGHGEETAIEFPLELDNYYPTDSATSIVETLKNRVAMEPFNLVASIIFLLAIIHTFLTAKVRHWAHEVEHAHAEKLKLRRRNEPETDYDEDGRPDEVSFKGQILHFLGEVEAVFSI